MKTTHILATALLAVSSSAFAQTVIDQNRALAGNVTPGDTPGFPITLSQHGSYKLTGNLTVPAGVNGIEIAAENVSIDFNGFTLSGPLTCTGEGASIQCSGSSNSGVTGTQGPTSKPPRGATLRNGTVTGFGINGIHVGAEAVVQAMRAVRNSQRGLYVQGSNALVEGRVFSSNDGNGISVAGTGALIRNVSAAGNRNYGIYNTLGSMTQAAVAHGNGQYGIVGGSVGASTLWGNPAGPMFGTLSMHTNLCNSGGNAVAC